MFWRFGFHNASAIESLIDKEASLATILDQDDLLQECKAQNSRLAEYFGRVGVLHRLFAYVTGEIEIEGKDRFKYPYVATEVLCSDIWSISATCVGKADVVLAPFWEFVLDRSPDDMKTRMVMASHFVKINLGFILKWPEKMLAFIQSQPNIVERLLRHIECSSFVDLIVQIISLDEHQRCGEVIEWLSSQNFIPRLVDMLSPQHSSDIHNAVADLIKGIISMATPSPASGLLDPSPASNLFARELASKEMVEKMTSYIVHDFAAPKTTAADPFSDTSPSDSIPEIETETLPSLDSSISSVTNSISIIIELIRKNNSDYFEPYLFHTLRNRLIHLQQHLTEEAGNNSEETRDILEQAMKELVNRMGVVNLGPVLGVVSESMEQLKKFLRNPRSLAGDIQTTVGSVTPLTFERFRICELFAELLHCSNMALLNRPSIHDQLYDSKGRLQGGLSALEDLAQVIQLNGSPEFDEGGVETTEDEDEVDDGDSGMMMAMSDIDSLPIAGMGGGGGSGGGSTATAERYRSQGVGSDDREGETGSIGSSDMTGSPGSSEDDEDDGDDKDEDDDDIGKMVEIAVGDDDEQQPKAGGGGKGLRIDTTPATISKRQHQQQQSQLLVESPSSIPDEVKSEAEGTAATSPQREEEIPRPANPDVDVQMAALSSSAAEYDENVLTPQISRASRRSTSRRSSRRTTLPEPLPDLSQTPGSQLKQRLLDLEILSTLLDLFFEFQWNNFLHSAVYDVIHQILTGNVEGGLNRELIISLFEDAKLMQRIVDGQKLNDVESAKPKGVRIGYMGHLTLLAEDVISALERYPTDLQSPIMTFAPQPEWDEYVQGRYSETKKKDRCALGGPKPNTGVIGVGGGGNMHLGSGGDGGALRINVDEGGIDGRGGMMMGGEGGLGKGGGRMIVDEGENGGNAMFPGLRLDESAMDSFRSRQQQQGIIEIEQGDIEGRRADVPEDIRPSSSSGGGSGGVRGQLRRVGSVGSGGREVRNTADFGSVTGGGAQDDSDSDDEEKYGNSRTTHFARYLAQELQSSNHLGESSDSSDDEEGGGWLSQSNFNLGSPPISARRPPVVGMISERRPLDASGFDDSFTPTTTGGGEHFVSHDDDVFGPFSDSAAAANNISSSPSALLSSSFSDDMDDSSFESFGDFGDFQSADGDTDFGPLESGGGGGGATTSFGNDFAPETSALVASSSASSNTQSTEKSGGDEGSGGSGQREGEERRSSDDEETLTLTPTSGSWTIAGGSDGFEEIRRVEKRA